MDSLTRQMEAATAFVEPIDRGGGVVFGRGTGTILLVQGRAFVLTNWHVIAGRAFARHEQIRESESGYPASLRLCIRDTRGGYVTITAPLYEENGRPRWIECATPADVVLVPFSHGDANIQVMGIDHIGTDVAVAPTEAVSLLGYPEGLSGRETPPIWKGGQLATQLDWPASQGRRFLVDVVTAPGMSGSAVYAVRGETWRDHAGNVVTCPEPRARLLGVYSQRQIRHEGGRAVVHGRLVAADDSAAEVRGTLVADLEVDLGLAVVWSSQLILEMVASIPPGG